ncbi:MAG: HD domain-containing protein [Planctomycetaceae bacterium]|nr:HD domain-containing protein [Planctomycetaceae bacterium]
MPPKRLFISDFKNGQGVDQVFLVREKDLRTTKSGDMYLRCTLADRSGSLPAIMWRVAETIYNSIAVDGFLQVKGRIEDYRGATQMTIDALRPVAADRVDVADFIPVTKRDIEQMWAELLEILRGVKNKHLRLLIKKFVEDREMVEGFKKAPAAMSMHNPYVGGLLEHTLMVAQAAKALLGLYPAVNDDLVLTSAFLHDIGKIAELSAGTSFSYTDRGQLVGHITIAAIWVEQKAAEVAAETSEPFPQKTIDLLQHIILSHHGVHEYGSPKLPACAEAYFIHFLDNLDAKMYMTLHAVEADTDPTSAFTAYMRELETRIYKGSAKLE